MGFKFFALNFWIQYFYLIFFGPKYLWDDVENEDEPKDEDDPNLKTTQNLNIAQKMNVTLKRKMTPKIKSNPKRKTNPIKIKIIPKFKMAFKMNTPTK